MPYLTHVHVHRCRNVHDLHVDLSMPAGERGFRHLILTGPNGSGKSGILEGLEDELVKTLFPAEASRRVLQQSRRRRRGPFDASLPIEALTSREHQVALDLAETALSFKEIADRLGMSEMTVRKHAQRIYGKLGVVSRSELTTRWNLNVRQAGPSLDLQWDADPSAVPTAFAEGEIIAIYLPSKRHIGEQDARGPSALEWVPGDLSPERELARKLRQFLVNKEAERAFALVRGDEPSAARAAAWVGRFGDHLRSLMNDPGLRIADGGLLDPGHDRDLEERLVQRLEHPSAVLASGEARFVFGAVRGEDVAAISTAQELDRIHNGTGSSPQAQRSARALREAVVHYVGVVAEQIRRLESATEDERLALEHAIRKLLHRKAPYTMLIRSVFSERPSARALFT